MDKKWVAIIILAFLIPVTILAFSLVNKSLSSSPSTVIETCNTLIDNGENKVDLVFFGEKNIVEKYANFFLTTSPFNKNKDEFNFYYIDSYKPKCEFYKGIAILCHSKELVKKAASCPNDYIVVLENQESKIRSSSYMNVLSINTIHPMSVLTHEFGHSYVNLAEEYTPAKIPRGSENCVSSCTEFSEKSDGCFQDCSDSSHSRSIENGVMRTLNSNSYGIFNENLILKKIGKNSNSGITGKAISQSTDCVKQEYYLIEGNLNGSEIEIVDKSLEDGCFGESGEGVFNYALEKTDNTIIQGKNFNPELIFTEAPGKNIIDGGSFSYEGNFLLKIPKITKVKSLSILEGDKEIIKISLEDVGVRACRI